MKSIRFFSFTHKGTKHRFSLEKTSEISDFPTSGKVFCSCGTEHILTPKGVFMGSFPCTCGRQHEHYFDPEKDKIAPVDTGWY